MRPKLPRVLFICNRRIDGYGYTVGLSNEAKRTCEVLTERGVIDGIFERVDDSNDVDRVTFHHKPDIVIIEAVWVPPQKLAVLDKIYTGKVKYWITRLHSNIPFLATEGNAMQWLNGYLAIRSPRILIGANSEHAVEDLGVEFNTGITYLPNVYVPDGPVLPFVARHNPRTINVACLGALRPMKNQLLQAIAAISFADDIGKQLVFHINADRVEQGGSNILKNLRALFASRTEHVLVENPWLGADALTALLSTMDISMQVSLSETFNLVTADAVTAGCPIVVSSEVAWAAPETKVAVPTSRDAIVHAMGRAYRRAEGNVEDNRAALAHSAHCAIDVWQDAIRGLTS